MNGRIANILDRLNEEYKGRTVMKVVCSWCSKDMGEKDGQGQTGVSHGICDECAENWGK